VKSSAKAILITGAGGYLGVRLAEHYLALGEQPVVLWLHAKNRQQLDSKVEVLRAKLGDNLENAEFRGGDLCSAEPFSEVQPEGIGRIVHSAAVTRFNVDRELANHVNVEGAVKLYEFACRCPALDRLALLSSVYACGLTEGVVAEAPIIEEPRFSNHYEWSKWESERRLMRDFGALPWAIMRIATVVSEDEGGMVEQYNAFHNTLKLLFYGLVSLIPGNCETPLYFVTADFAVNAIANALEHDGTGNVFNVCHSRDESMTLGELMDAAFDRFREDPDFAARRILEPLYCDEPTFGMLADAVGAFSGDVVRQGLASIAPFAAQLFSEKSFANDRLREACSQYRAPDADLLIRNTCDYLARTRWGARLDRAA
jgi:nucleoside-diphosphate-sugar epimerase